MHKYACAGYPILYLVKSVNIYYKISPISLKSLISKIHKFSRYINFYFVELIV